MKRHIKGVVLVGLLALLLVAAVLPIAALAEAAEPDTPVAGMIDLTPIVQAMITIFAAIITIKIVPWIEARTSSAQHEALGFVTRTLVYAAEQIFGSKTGKKKLTYVKAKLMEHGYDIDTDVIEAAVRELSLDGANAIENAAAVEEDEDTEPPDGPDNPAE